MLVGAGGVGDRGQHEVDVLAVQAGQAAAEVDGGVAVVEGGGDLQEPLLAAGQGADLGGDGVEVDPVTGRGRVHPRAAGVGEPAVEAADQQLGRGLQAVDALGPGAELGVVLAGRRRSSQAPPGGRGRGRVVGDLDEQRHGRRV